MIAAALLTLSLAVNVTYEPEDLAPRSYQRELSQMSPQQKFATLKPLVRSATDCVVRTIEADPHFSHSTAPADVNELIVSSMASCADVMRSMIEAHDRLFGEGSGEAFFMGPYLEGLPLTVNKMVKGAANEPKPNGAPQAAVPH
jgi:hypothetical protein